MPKKKLHIGILLCDSMLGHWAFTKYGELDQWLASALTDIDPDLSFQTFRALDEELPASPQICDAWLITGSPNGVYDDLPWINNLITFTQTIHQARKPLFGICFGHQVIATALGGRVEKCDRGWDIGITQYTIQNLASWMQPPPPDHEHAMFVFHQDQVLDLPLGTKVLSGNHFCPNFWLEFDERTASTQGHPELFREFYTHVLNSESFADQPKLREYGLTRIAQATPLEPNAKMLFSWIVAFYRQAQNIAALDDAIR